MSAYARMEELPWKPHPAAENVDIKPLVSKTEQNAQATVMYVKVPVGVSIKEHTHENEDDILYPLQGKGKMYVEGTGEFDLEPGIVVHVPKGARHRIFDVTEELLILDVFSPALF